MHRIDSAGNVSGLYTNGNPALGQEATVADAAAMNALQEETCAVIEAEGITLVKGNNGQLLQALDSRYARKGAANEGAWTNLTLAAGWNNPFTGQEPQYRIDQFGRVWFRGDVYRVGGAGTPPGPIVDALPVAARPPGVRSIRHPVSTLGTSTQELRSLLFVSAGNTPAGQVNLSGTAAVTYVTLDGVAYYTS